MTDPLDHERLADLIRQHHIRAWSREAFAWPTWTVVLASIAYTVVGSLNSSALKLSGELIGSGGMLLGVVMLASAQSRLRDWIEVASPIRLRTGAAAEHLDALAQIPDRFTMWQWTCICGALAFAALHVSVEHTERSRAMYMTTALLLYGNLVFIFAVRQFCHNRMYTARTLLLLVHDDCKGAPEVLQGGTPPPT